MEKTGSTSIRGRGKSTSMAQFLLARCILAVSVSLPGVSGGALAQSQSNVARLEISCPTSGSPFVSAQPSKVYPSSEVPLEIEYSRGPDAVVLSGDETEVFANLGGGDDLAYLYDTGTEAGLLSGTGADTVILCSMTDLNAMISLGGDTDSDVVIIEASVFTTVPAGMVRTISIMELDPTLDTVVIRAPAGLLEGRDSSRHDAALRIGDVVFTTISLSMIDGLNSTEAFRFVPTAP